MKYFCKISLLLLFIPVFSKAQNASDDKCNFYVSVALNNTTTTPSSSSPFYESGGSSYISHLPAFTFGISVPMDASTGKLLFRGELSLFFSKYNSLYKNETYPYVDARASFNELGISLTPQIIYNFYNADNFKFYGGIGLAVTNSFYSNVYYGSQDPNSSFIGNNDYNFIKFDTRVLLKGGIQLHKNWEVYFNYLTSGQTTDRGYFQLNKTNEQVGINYIF